MDPDPSKVVVLLKREHDFQNIMFFYKKNEFQTNHDFSENIKNCGPLKMMLSLK